MHQALHSTSKIISKKGVKIPTVFLATAHISENIKNEVLDTLEEGLSHLNIKLLKGDISEKLLEKSNIIVLFDEDKAILNQAWEEGVVPVVSDFNDVIVDYNPNTETGNGFVYDSLNYWEIFTAIVRACETYKFPYDWKFIVRSCKKSRA
ncbi:hypothetical protein J7J83_04535 [bacterium]|nr:hypothetical protein [bacterium]